MWRDMHEGMVLAFDFGTRRIGVAVGEMMLGTARPLTTISVEANDVRFAAIAKLTNGVPSGSWSACRCRWMARHTK